jgi:S1-C subfamily serine protease
MSRGIALALSGALLLAQAAAVQNVPGSLAAPPAQSSTPTEILDRLAPSVVQVLPQASRGSESWRVAGSGVAVAGGIVTTDQVIGDADQAEIVANDGRRGAGTVARRSPLRDLLRPSRLSRRQRGQRQLLPRQREFLRLSYPHRSR